MEGHVVAGLMEAGALAMNNYDWRPVRTFLEDTVAKGSIEYTQLQQIHVSFNLIEEACSRGFTELVSVFLKSGFQVDSIVNGNNETMLHLAAMTGHLSLVKLLLNVGADIDCKTYYGETPLFYAVKEDNLEVVKYLISAGSDINILVGGYSTLLDVADGNSEGMYELLLQSGCDPNYKSYLHRVSNNVKIVKMFLDVGFCVNGKDSDIPLLQAARYGNIPVMQLLLDYGADINAKNHHGDTALHRAVVNGKLQSVEFMIKHGSLINSVNNNEETPLSISFQIEQFDIAMLLLNSGADDVNLDIPHDVLHRAIDRDAHIQLIEYLLEHGANVRTVCYNETAVQHVAYSNYSSDKKLKIAKLLLIYGSDHYVEDRYGNTVLHWACTTGDVGLVEYLIYYGLDVDAKNIEGMKPYDIAKEKGHTNIVKTIIHYHCNKYTSFN